MTSPSVITVLWKTLYLTTGCRHQSLMFVNRLDRSALRDGALPGARHLPARGFDARLTPAVPAMR
ncbi:hypothetical protein CFB43_13590 [Burkholderia sp. AU15512]|nr:hypothetical protein CFB43_13590 [Burkholderia sp. AU15512]